MAVLLVAGLVGCTSAGGAQPAVSSQAAEPSGAASGAASAPAAGAGGAARGRELVAELEGQLQPPSSALCLTLGGRECAVWLGGVTKTATVSVPNHADRFPVSGGREPRVRALVTEISAAGESYALGGCEQQARFVAKGPCERDAAAIVVKARLLADELKAGGWA
ncbi:hypothetical protein ABTX81_30540 [Kitasatospora sp. NPDC097605]|uniref:hypothetical protein n=1 Tax=Kitasatospora sp. NPDC097605 TaxID=3157226 RepID=UPI00332034EA